MIKKELVLVCGISGAGKTVTMDYFDKSGFYCIDNLPINALPNTVKALQDEDAFERFAIALNSNVSENEINEILTIVKSFEWINLRILFLEVSDEELLKRFQLTRKTHPFQKKNENLSEAIREERRLLRNLRQHATVVLDTTDFTPKKLVSMLSKSFEYEVLPEFRVAFVSFGYKHGLPQSLDYAFDVRFI
ncbi:MAG: RNase adapter RapZ, partial [Erysipelotrichales bacterium]